MTASAGDADWVHDADWGLTSATADALTVDGDWVLADGPCSPRRYHLIGFFLVSNGRHIYVPLLQSSDASRADDLISSVPISASICASTQGIVLARAPWSSYYISTPISPKWTRIPHPMHSHPISIPVALVATGDAGHGDGFLIICSVPSADGPQGFYRFDIYESSTGKWRTGPDRFPTGEILPSSGVSCGSAVYFRTETPSVVSYDDAAGVARVLPPPPRCWGSEVQWELAVANGRLWCVCVRGRVVEVYQLGERDLWTMVGQSDAIDCSGDPPRPLRAQSAGLGVVLWTNGRLGRWDLEHGRAIQLCFGEAAPPPGSCAQYVPYCAELELRR
ncbi:hypothetical protein IEQ34_027021 [Dendrobium chrysotoxum]|uniref:F-box protein At3g26010-like beta-propeller domain-containing protein n=1 Tax=Dendrobium chrysotoxum TaxID=161865 RepID=A0AAV7FI96_DENCH|nr:hypothetical protein IEQ34_027021 [Dendrobium chrysotoxum]